ncbi:MAG: apolipoprotein N-acyltransferase [Caldimonas sp.]
MNAGDRSSPPGVDRGPARVWPIGAELAFVAALGALQTLAYVHTVAWPLQLGCVALLARRVLASAPRRAALLGLAYGTAWLGAGTWWLYISLHDYGGLPAWLTVVAVALLSSLLSLYMALAMAAFSLARRGSPLHDAMLFGAAWLLAELARAEIFTGFPWIASGYAHVDSPLAGFAPWVGVYGIGFIGAALAAWVASRRHRGLRDWVGSAGAVVGVLVLGQVAGTASFSSSSGRLAVTLLQGNVPQDEKFAAERLPATLAWTSEQLRAARGDLVVAPETVIPLLPDQLDPEYWLTVLDHFQLGRQSAIVGLPLGDPESGYTNSAAGISASTAHLPGGYYRYDKHHLVPFGEFIPLGFHWFTQMMNIPLGDFNRGPLAAPSFVVKDQRVAPNICYEDLFGEELAKRFGDAGTAPTIFANISNIAWFGKSIAIDQHLQISRMRTLEFERPMLRATNTGATAVIDYRGRVTAMLEPYTQGVLDAVVEGRNGLTPFARWAGAFGLWPAWLLGAGIVATAIRRRPRL